jgi:hypothetical protein
MNDEELATTLETLADSMRYAQAVGRVNGFLLGEIVHDLADRARNRHDYLAGMFGRISARLDKLPNEKNLPRVSDLAREELSKFFASVAKSQ